MLLEEGADKDKGDNEGCTPLFLACWKGYFEMAQYLVEKGVTLDKATDKGYTPLITAAANGQLEVCSYLLEQGADRDKADNIGRTPIHWGCLRWSFRRCEPAHELRGGLGCEDQ